MLNCAGIISGGQGKSGVDLGPNALVERGLLSQLSELGWNVHYEGPAEFDDIPYINPNQPGASNGREVLPDPDIGKMKKPRLVSAVNQRAMEIIRDHAMEGRLPLTLGGDHSLVSVEWVSAGNVKGAYEQARFDRPWRPSRESRPNTPTHVSFGYVICLDFQL